MQHYIANGGAVIPCYGGKASDTDKAAVEVLQKAYGPERKACPRLLCSLMWWGYARASLLRCC